MTTNVLTARDIDQAMLLVRTSTLTLDAIGAMWLVSGEAIGYHMKRLGVVRGNLAERRFWNRVDQTTTPDGCWPWMGSRSGGYGHVRRDGKIWITHRLAYALTYGQIPPGMLVCHSCDNPPCCNPEHLFLGTDADNSRDRNAKGRQARLRGTANGNARLTLWQVADIRTQAATGRRQRDIAADYGIAQTTVSKIARGRSYVTAAKAEAAR